MSSAKIKRRALEAGYTACGIIPARVFDEYTRSLDERSASFPESKKLYEPFYNIARPPENAKSVIVCTQRFNKYKIPESLKELIGKIYLFDGRISYSHENRMRLEFEEYLKTLGINAAQCFLPARWAAAKAGLGKFGRNNFIYDKENGSYVWIETWAAGEELDYDTVEENAVLPACNDSCNKCINACPTKALSGSLSMNIGRCITHIQCYAKDILDEETRSQMGLWVYGCDVCQDVCPLNEGKFTETQNFPLLDELEEYLSPEKLLEMDEETYIKIINPRFWYIGKDNIWLWKCNALRSMINSKNEKYHQLIKKCREHEDTRIKELAVWGCGVLGI
jgi:epoxyqueuosine reductase